MSELEEYKKLYEIIRDWERQGFITIHQWKNFADYIDILLRKERRKTAERIFERLEKESSGCRLDGGIIYLIFPLKTIENLKKEFLGGGNEHT